MIRRPPRSTLSSSSAASDVYKRQLLKGTQVDGVYNADPKKDPSAVRYESLSYMDVLTQDLKVMDASAISLSRENNIPIVVFSIHAQNALVDVLQGNCLL
eukprot:TRINITY_DN56595_c0_g1_i1.p1 TRINITY_DN56595_c0_g1~~TRINITY_DN56595_c0_g1_i1.p1  ORF type:complete len:100 (+),score=15.33 TRINITY_DN56595_c0_g1_i1:121-420(+)